MAHGRPDCKLVWFSDARRARQSPWLPRSLVHSHNLQTTSASFLYSWRKCIWTGNEVVYLVFKPFNMLNHVYISSSFFNRAQLSLEEGMMRMFGSWAEAA